MKEPQEGDYATLNEPYLGYTRILLIKQTPQKWLVEICGSGKETEFWADEFEVDDNRTMWGNF